MRSGWMVMVSLMVALMVSVGCGGSSVPEQLGEACTDIGDAFCERAVDCGFIAGNEQVSCVNAFYAACCADDGTCNRPLDTTITSDEWDDCLDAISIESCADLDNGNLPTQCLSL